MSGIAAIVNINQVTVPSQQIETVTRAVTHRGSHKEAYFFSQNLAIGYCMNLLSAQNPAAEPFDDERCSVLIDGEIFNRTAILAELEVIENLPDAEIIALAYQRWKMDFIEHIDGKWAILIYDKIQNKIIIFRDRFAFKPIYFATINQHFCIVSEIKQLTHVIGWQPQLNIRMAQDFLIYGHQDHTRDTFFNEVKQLMAGEYLCLDLKTFEATIHKYYTLEKYTPQYLPFEKAQKQYQTIISESIQRHLTSGQRLGTMLSGGLDSTIVSCVLNSLVKEKNDISINAFSLVLNEKSNLDETPFIDLVGNFTHIPVHKITTDFSTFKNELNAFVYAQDEPVYTDSAYAQYAVFRQVADLGIKQIFGGTGADAALAGYTKYMLVYLQQLYREGVSMTILKELIGFLRYNGFWAVQHLLKKRGFTDNKASHWLNANFLLSDYSHEPFQSLTLYDYSLQIYLTDATVALHYDDRSASAFGLESYFPMYDRAFVELSLQLPDEYKIKNGKQKHILREAFKDTIPQKIYNRHDKKGFYNPGEIWIQQNPDWWMSQMREIILENPRIFNSRLLSIFEAFAHHNKLTVNEGVFWRTFFFGKWLQQFSVTY